MDLHELIATGRLDRRTLLKIAAATGGAATAARLVGPGGAVAQEEPTLVTSIRSLSNPYHAVWAKGGDTFAESVGLKNEVQTTEGDSQKGIAAINAALASSGQRENFDGGSPLGRSLGVELDVGVELRVPLQPPTELRFSVQSGVVFPGSAFDAEDGSGLGTQAISTAGLGLSF